ncbi:radical SAM protein [Verrucomicrobiota bacterium]
MFRYAPHFGEEPPISGDRGSGTVFFSRCTLNCIYCQNYPWSQEGRGDEYDKAGLAGILRSLHREGCHNWNLVSPTPWLPRIREALRVVVDEGISLPVVINTSSYERTETLAEYADMIDIFLADLRYALPGTAFEGSGVRDYVETARAALREMWRMAGPLRVDDDGLALSGVICRLLILPGHAEEAVANMEWLADTMGTDMAVSLMAQYTPAHKAVSEQHWGRRIIKSEYMLAFEALERLGFDRGWVQDPDDSTPGGLVGFEMKQSGV